MSRIRANQITNQSADGAPTVQNGLVISGMTTSTTFSGSGASLTNLNASNIASGTVPTARLGSGTASSSTFLRGDSTFQTVNTDLVSDSSPQLGGMLESNGNNIKIADSDIIVLGTGNDLQISHTSNISRLRGATTNDIHIESAANFKVRHQDTDGSNAEDMLICTGDGAVELYFNNSKKIESTNTGAVVTGILTATAFVPTSQGALSHRNIIINGAMIVAQRATSATGVTANGYATVDRFTATQSGTDDYIEQHQVDVSSGTTPYTLGFRKAFQVKNGNQTSGAGAGDYIKFVNKLEAQDIANSGWNYKSASSFITLSYWVRSSVAQTFFVRVTSLDSPVYNFPFSYAVSANTWTKVTKAIPGNSNLVFNNDNGTGLDIEWTLFRGTNSTGSGATLDTWAAYDSSQRQPDNTSTWYTTNDATWEITGIQFEVGPVATPFEHRSYGEELLRCKRYYQRSTDSSRGTDYTLSTGTWHSADGSQSFSKHNSYYDWKQNFEVEMRVAPTLTIYGSSNQGDIHLESIAVGSKQVDWNNNTTEVKTKGFLLRHIEDQSSGNYTSGSGNAFGILAYTVDAEL